MSVTIYHNPACGTSRNALAMIRQSGEEPEVVEYLKNPPSRARLIELVRAMGIPVRALLREKGTPYAELGLADPKWSDDQLIDFMLAHPILINRPIVVTPKGTRLCRPSEAVLDLLEHPVGSFVKEDGEIRLSWPAATRAISRFEPQITLIHVNDPILILSQHGVRRWRMYKHILLPTDGSELSKAAVRHGIALAKAIGAKVTALVVSTPLNSLVVDPSVVSSALDQYKALVIEQTAKYLDNVRNNAVEAGVDCSTLCIEHDKPYEAIIDTAKKQGCDLVVMASHGLRGVSAILGSETLKVLTHTSVPILVYR